MAKSSPAKKQVTATSKAGNGTHDYIEHHDEIPNKQEPKVTEIITITVEEQIALEVKKFGNAEEQIAKLKEEYTNMNIVEKEDYDLVKQAWNQVRDFRTGIEKKKSDIKRDYLAIGKAIDGAENKLVALIKPLEDLLYGRWKAVDDQKVADKQKKLLDEENKLKARINKLVSAGMALIDGWYCLGDSITVDVATVRGMPDDKYDTFLEKVVTTKIRLDEQKQVADKLATDKKRDEDARVALLQKQQDDLDKANKLLKDQQDQLEREKKAAAKVKRDNRINAFKAMGYSYSTYDDKFQMLTDAAPLVISGESLFSLDDEAFTVASANWKEQADLAGDRLIAQKQQYELAQKKLDERKDRIAGLFQGLGMTYNLNAGTFTFENRLGKVTADMDSALELAEDELTKAVSATSEFIKQKINDLTALETTEKNQAEQDRQMKLGDKALIGEFFDNLRKVKTPYSQIKSKGALEVYNAFNVALVKLLSSSELKLKQLSEEGQP